MLQRDAPNGVAQPSLHVDAGALRRAACASLSTAEPQRATELRPQELELGLHARAATKLVQLAAKFPCEITVGRAGQTANAKSVMGVLLLCGSKGTLLDVEATGHSAEEAVQSIGKLIHDRFGEEE